MSPPPAGVRPRVEGEREDEILEAALRLLLEMGYDRLTMDAVAKEAKASKATLYRRWENKANLVLDALLRAKPATPPACPDTGTLRGDLIGLFCGKSGMGSSTMTRAMGAVVTALCNDPEFAEVFRERFIAPKVALSTEIYRRAQARGEIPEDLDLEVIAPALAGIVLHRAFVLGLPLDDGIIERVVDHVILPAVGHQPSPGPSPTTERTTRKTGR